MTAMVATLEVAPCRALRAKPVAGILAGNPAAALIGGDATKSSSLRADSVDLVVTSPPYNLSMAYNGSAAADAVSPAKYAAFSEKWLSNCYRWTRPTGRLCVNVSIDKNKNGKMPLAAKITEWAMAAGWNYHATILWMEGNISKRTAWGSWKSASAPHVIAPVEIVIVLYLVLYDAQRPIVLTMKVSLRERYKQADLEGLALRQVYRRALSYLVTLSKSEVPRVRNKIESGDIAGLDRCILADKPEYSQMLAELAKRKFQHARPIVPLRGTVYPKE